MQRSHQDEGCCWGVEVSVRLWDMPSGNHGFHVHKTGNLVEGSHSLCEHFGTGVHGDLNDPNGHAGDMGNLFVTDDSFCTANLIARYLTIDGHVKDSIIGRSIVVHAGEDDLGLGNYSDSKTSGHSGDRMLFGIIGRDEGCK